MNLQINIIAVLIILAFHWLTDFVLQTDLEAKNKSTNNKALLSHTGVYSLMWFLLAIATNKLTGFSYINCLEFGLITFIAHTITDYFTSRLNTKLYKEGKIHEFFVSVGIDQYYHYVQLLLTYQLLSN